MVVFIYEHLTAGGLFDPRSADQSTSSLPSQSLLAEGRAMANAIAQDFAAVPGVRVCGLRDARLDDFRPVGAWKSVITPLERVEQFDRLQATADWTLLIAPETHGVLYDLCRRVETGGGRLLGPSSQTVALAADKHALCERLRSRGVPVPRGIALSAGEAPPADFSFPAVLKPRFGCGSQDVRRIGGSDRMRVPFAARLETYCSGQACSVSVLCGGAGLFPLSPCRQHLSQDGTFQYVGGSLPMPLQLANRATRLATKAAAALDDPVGYLGVDVVLGDDASGAQDVVIEINPRLTTSYVGLRHYHGANLAQGMLDAMHGRAPQLGPIGPEAATFLADGTICLE